MSGIVPEIFKEEKCCYYDENKCGEKCKSCFVNAKKSLYSRKCFMTGEYCSKQTSIQRERKELHDKDEINAFVIMSFSDMTDVVYEWRIKRFIEKLKKYLAFDVNRNKIFCSKEEIIDELELKEEERRYHRVKEIHVERADTDVSSNYVMCSRICQRIQMADLIVVDVSHQNPNVFYELGMAIALGKLILPICFSESYHKMDVPKLIKETDEDYKMIEHHIGSYPWRKALFEYYGIFQKQREEPFDGKDRDAQRTHYMEYANAKDIRFGFSDIQYSRFPYDAEFEIVDKNTGKTEKRKIGEKLYNELRDSYNLATRKDNTLLVYIMDGFLNDKEAGICIVNFYHTITAKMQENLCFCGDRVGVLVQGNGIPEEDKDSDKQIDLFYSIGEIIHIGVNQATYLAQEEKLKADDVINVQKNEKNKIITQKQSDGILRTVKGYIRNRGVIIYPNNPVYVKRELEKFKFTEGENVLQDENPLQEIGVCNCSSNKVHCLYHKTLHSLRYVNEVVIDISNNSIQALFWLGVAHGSSVNAIIVLHEATEKECEKITGSKEKKIRTVFDVAGLWSAVLHSNDTQGFYRQLAQAQYGIEQHAKLVLKDKDMHEKKLHDAWVMMGERFVRRDITAVYKDEKKEVLRQLESYYRSRFWNAMLRHNQLLICMPQIEHSKSDKEEPRGYTSKWDFKASSLLSHYLSKRTVISEYQVEAIKGKKVENIEQMNFISLGAGAKPLGESLSHYILNNRKVERIIHEHDSKEFTCQESEKEEFRIYKGFKEIFNEKNKLKESELGLYTQHPQFECSKKCSEKECLQIKNKIVFKTSELKDCECSLCGRWRHTEIAQLIIWRESSNNFHEKTVFRVAINGSSGPATLGLSAILVGDDQKIELFQAKKEGKKSVYKYERNLLYDLQVNVRGQFMNIYKSKLCDEIEEILNTGKNKKEKNRNEKKKKPYSPEQKERYKELVWYAVSTYLYNELYCYFLPLLSDKDIYSLCNGMYNFVNHMRMENESPFDIDYPDNGDGDFQTAIVEDDVIDIIKVIPDVLSLLLKGFCGLEVFYEVRVKHNSFKNEKNVQEKKNAEGEKGEMNVPKDSDETTTYNQNNGELDTTKNNEKREDTREVVDIKMLDVDNNVNCLWKSDEEEKKND